MADFWNHADIIFSALLNRAFAATFLLLAAAAYRLVFPKAPKWTRLSLWALAAVRLCLPVSIESQLSLVPSETVIDYEVAQFAAHPTITSGIAVLNSAVNPAFGDAFAANPQRSVNPLQVWMFAAGIVWAAGLLVLLALAVVSFIRLKRRVRASIEIEPGVRICDDIDTPFLLGLLRPRIYLPSSLPESDRDFVLAHERAHRRHGDCVWKLLGVLITCVYWFDPLAWLCCALFCRDLELACDERVVKQFALPDKKRYATVLLSCSVPKNRLTACPLAFGEVGVKERVKRILDKKPAKILVALALLVCAAIGVCFLTSHKESIVYCISDGTYVAEMDGEASLMAPRVTFFMGEGQHEFTFSISPLSSTLMVGEFTIGDGEVTCSDGSNTLVFRVTDNDTLELVYPYGGYSSYFPGMEMPAGAGVKFRYEQPDEEVDLSGGAVIHAVLTQEDGERDFSHLVTNSTRITVSCDSIPKDAEVLISMYIEAQETPIRTTTLTSKEPSMDFTALTVVEQYKIRAVVKNCPDEITLTITD